MKKFSNPYQARLLLTISLVFVAAGLVMLVCDWDTFRLYGVHINEVAAITDEGDIIAWPTGEAPWFAEISIRAWILLFSALALSFYSLRFLVGRDHLGRICRGVE
jgi:membrane-anchored protein YejM (alkaline phosphatase superfamily)